MQHLFAVERDTHTFILTTEMTMNGLTKVIGEQMMLLFQVEKYISQLQMRMM